ncbi:MAG: hypothetical protein K6G27_11985 [Lachnospiraceae bacterium]|nr:hypothetical protein [Lachnospiraceae bacterium]
MNEKLSTTKKRTIQYFLISAVITSILTIVSVIKAQGIFFPTDEFGYWSNAASILGIDWSNVTAGMSSYAPGYSLLLVPIMALGKNPVVMYMAALILNGLLLLLSTFLFMRLITIIYGEPGIWVIPCFLFPAYLVYMSYTISEVLLYALFLELCCVMARISGGERKVLLICCGVLVAALMVSVHYRTVGILVVYVFVCFLSSRGRIVSGKKSMMISAIVLCFLFAAMVFYSRTGGSIGNKDYDPAFFSDLILGAAGKIFYTGAATFGTGLIGLAEVYRRRKEPFGLFILLSFVYMVILGSFYFCGGTRMDQPVYGRYEEMFLPLLMYFGIRNMSDRNKRPEREEGKALTRAMIFMGITALMLTLYITYLGKTEYVADFVNGIDWMFGMGMPKVSTVYITPFVITSIMLVLLDKALQKEKLREVCAACFSCIFIVSAVFLSYKHVWRYQDADAADRMLAERAEAFFDDGRELIFLNSPYNDYVNLLQFWFKDKRINIIEGLSPEAFQTPENAVVITYADYECDDQLSERYDDCMSSVHFRMYSNITN